MWPSLLPTQPRNIGLHGVKQIMRYHCQFRPELQPSQCIAYSDSDWAGDLDDSSAGLSFSDQWECSQLEKQEQSCVALSTAEAALSSVAQEAIWMRQLTSELGYTSTEPINQPHDS